MNGLYLFTYLNTFMAQLIFWIINVLKVALQELVVVLTMIALCIISKENLALLFLRLKQILQIFLSVKEYLLFVEIFINQGVHI